MKIDLRSDTLTKPSLGMRKAMYDAEVGDDVFKEDPTVNKLEDYAAELLGKEAALFVTSGVMGNQICLNVSTNRSDEVICEEDAHIFHYESGSPAALSGIQLYPVKGKNGVITPAQVDEAFRPLDAYYMPRSKVLALENSHNRAGGTVIGLEEMKLLKNSARKYNLLFHLDGARVWNAATYLGVEVNEITQLFDSVSCCLSKGLGAPIGSIIGGTKEFIKEAYRVRKGWGGGMRQSGVIAAAGLYALQNNIARLPEDHEKAKILATAIEATGKFIIDVSLVHTNMVIFKPIIYSVDEVLSRLTSRGVLLSTGKVGYLRAVTHLDVSIEEIEKAVEIFNLEFGK